MVFFSQVFIHARIDVLNEEHVLQTRTRVITGDMAYSPIRPEISLVFRLWSISCSLVFITSLIVHQTNSKRVLMKIAYFIYFLVHTDNRGALPFRQRKSLTRNSCSYLIGTLVMPLEDLLTYHREL